MKRKILFCLIFCIALIHAIYAGNDFTDIQNHWAESTILKLHVDGLVNGYSDGTFKPENEVRVAEFLKLAVTAGNYEIVREGNNVWPDFYINTAIKNSLIEDDTFDNYERAITRYEACEILSRFLNLSDEKESRNIFKDLNDENKSSVLKLVELDVIKGYKDKTFRGDMTLTRAESAVLISRCMECRDKLIKDKKYDYTNPMYSNYLSEDATSGAHKNTRYKIENELILIYDTGKFAKLAGHEVASQFVENASISNLIKTMVKENKYVAIEYRPSDFFINQLRILYGDSEEKVACGETRFSVTIYEDEAYELARISMEEKFSNECIMKIEITKLWDEYSEFLNKKYVDKNEERYFKDAMSCLLGANSESISKYMIKKYENYVSGKDYGVEKKEHKNFGKYAVDFYQKADGIPTFYISIN